MLVHDGAQGYPGTWAGSLLILFTFLPSYGPSQASCPRVNIKGGEFFSAEGHLDLITSFVGHTEIST